ncbi:TIGR03618 family F420-dependent PPOX class oxidoreductase [Cellulomonas sp. zg-ZUI222]|uniref:TIGR03618 family F420-dependent PPOX class oxidoreductase n=1 Tax=Cellulomonas wangleii TaxID=2816956 RepID=A0ABX8D2L2_9CELL|nr:MULTISPECIES: TIGR03618 family F420-dependent PPOX class oxidoreductase [Cellulomonas]MBO0899384.1 TIGR03618 family F420-dependent PPOX class oxidoreductase [Cellulomonas sp. zg-ZUI22]MBO0920236.1 TIGR03618 family F420-dependent PPOX class oxidoreductase [Cellulomonas wangleii]MBO0923338.1 TIGR03618 family F420-dependent PPOX class oxidoreductase [Cellulomonas wangleii]QVI61695.1 TIGR03618 family F420-dependent PPOX class oxidoreductase [Cellulomonas wangleii]
MPQPPLPADVIELLTRPNPAVMATVHPDGYPVTVATWYLLEDDGRVLLNLDASRARLRHLRENPHVSLTALAEHDWYTHVSVQGRVVEIVDDVDLVDIDRLSTHYGGKPYPVRDRARVSVRVEIDRWHGWGAAKQD